jgi:hypothetical protein
VHKKEEFLYIPQQFLASDPFEYNLNTEIVPASGASVEEQDAEIVKYFSSLENNYGSGNVLGILAVAVDHFVGKREAKIGTTTEYPAVTTTSGPAEITDGLVYVARGKGIISTFEAPVLRIPESSKKFRTIELVKQGAVSGEREGDREVNITVDFFEKDESEAVS